MNKNFGVVLCFLSVCFFLRCERWSLCAAEVSVRFEPYCVPIVPRQKCTLGKLIVETPRPLLIDSIEFTLTGDLSKESLNVFCDSIEAKPQSPTESHLVFRFEQAKPFAIGSNSMDVQVLVKENESILSRFQIEWTGWKEGGKEHKIARVNDKSAGWRLAQAIHRRGEAGCHTTRIPGLTTTSDGTLIAVFDMRYDGPRDLQGHIDIGMSRSTDHGQTWSIPNPIMDMGLYGNRSQAENGCSDPNILYVPSTNELLVSALWVHGKPNTHQWVGRGSEPGFEIGKTAQFMVVRSSDNGLTWSSPENWSKQVKRDEWYLFAPSPGNSIVTRDGTWVIPTQGRDANGYPFSNVMWSRDGGKSWTVSNPARDNTTESTVAELVDGQWMLNMRDNRNRDDKSETNGRAVSTTKDRGESWSTHESDHSRLPEPVCMGSLLSTTTSDGRRILLFSNPMHKTNRKNMTIQSSTDMGISWPNRLPLDEIGGAYSCMTMIDPKTIGILYESSQANLVFQAIPLRDVLGPLN